MKKYTCLLCLMLVAVLVLFAGCENKKEEEKKKKEDNTIEITYNLGKGIVSLKVPKKEDGTP